MVVDRIRDTLPEPAKSKPPSKVVHADLSSIESRLVAQLMSASVSARRMSDRMESATEQARALVRLAALYNTDNNSVSAYQRRELTPLPPRVLPRTRLYAALPDNIRHLTSDEIYSAGTGFLRYVGRYLGFSDAPQAAPHLQDTGIEDLRRNICDALGQPYRPLVRDQQTAQETVARVEVRSNVSNLEEMLADQLSNSLTNYLNSQLLGTEVLGIGQTAEVDFGDDVGNEGIEPTPLPQRSPPAPERRGKRGIILRVKQGKNDTG